MRAILIDPLARTVTEVQVDPKNTLASLYRIMGCRTVEVHKATDDMEMWCDENGRFLEHNGAFRFDHGMGRLTHLGDFAGPCVLLGHKPSSDGPASCDMPKWIPVEFVKSKTIWTRKGRPPRMDVVTFDGESCAGTWDGFTVGSDADPGL